MTHKTKTEKKLAKARPDVPQEATKLALWENKANCTANIFQYQRETRQVQALKVEVSSQE